MNLKRDDYVSLLTDLKSIILLIYSIFSFWFINFIILLRLKDLSGPKTFPSVGKNKKIKEEKMVRFLFLSHENFSILFEIM